MVMAGLLPRKIREGFYHPRALHIYDSMENCIPLYRQKYQEEGQILFRTFIEWKTSFMLLDCITYTSIHTSQTNTWAFTDTSHDG